MIGSKAADGQSLGCVTGIDYLDYLVELSKRNVSRGNPELLAAKSIKFFRGDGWSGLPECAPFDAIHVGAAASEVPEALRAQLKPGGRMLVPIGSIGPDAQQQLTLIDHRLDGTFSERQVGGVRFVPLVKHGSGSAGGEVSVAELHMFARVHPGLLNIFGHEPKVYEIVS